MIKIRKATREDCPAMLELIRELALYEKAPEEVTVDPQHFEESGFGSQPVWWAFVAEEKVDEVEGGEERFREVELSTTSHHLPQPPSTSLNLPQPSRIVAFSLYYIRYSTWKGQVMYLEDILVTERMRGKGIGSMLMDMLIAEAKEKGFKRMVWQVLEWNEPAINFYKKYKASFDPEWVNVIFDL